MSREIRDRLLGRTDGLEKEIGVEYLVSEDEYGISSELLDFFLENPDTVHSKTGVSRSIGHGAHTLYGEKSFLEGKSRMDILLEEDIVERVEQNSYRLNQEYDISRLKKLL